MPYISPQEFADTFVDVNLSRYVPSGTQAANSLPLLAILRQASSLADQWCRQLLRATEDSGSETLYPSKFGDIRIWPKYRPIVQLSSLKYRVQANNSLSRYVYPQVQYSGSWIDVTTLTDANGVHLFDNYFVYDGTYIPQSNKVVVDYSYVNGFPVVDVDGTVAKGATTITTKQTPVGILQNSVLTLVDGELSEDVTVQSVSSNTITLVSPTVNDHTSSVGLTLSGIPDAIKRATGIIASNIIKRGVSGATTVHDTDYEMQYKSDSNITDDAKTLLYEYRIHR